MNNNNILKNNDVLRRTVKMFKIRKEYRKDSNQFIKHYMDSSKGINQIEYKILFLAHSLEKGMTHKDLRPFGKNKVKDILDCLEKIDSMNIDKKSTSYNIGISIISKWKDLYDSNNWSKDNIYNMVNDYINNNKNKALSDITRNIYIL